MKYPKIFKFKKFVKKSGKLLPITFDKKFPIKVKRIFFIYGKTKYKRGEHAHKKCTQVFYPIFGKIRINLEYKKIKKSVILDHTKLRAFILPPKIWCSVDFLSKNSIVLVLNDYKYDYNDYIESYKEFSSYY
tara:strand:- start:246 stop:641 length:396 start_codon:yes stop_codon:yes gene_type:complete